VEEIIFVFVFFLSSLLVLTDVIEVIVGRWRVSGRRLVCFL